MAHFEQECWESGIKLIHRRIAIFREVAQTGDQPDVETVYQGVRKRLPTVSLDTVYRTLWMLKDLSLVTTLGTARETACQGGFTTPSKKGNKRWIEIASAR